MEAQGIVYTGNCSLRPQCSGHTRLPRSFFGNVLGFVRLVRSKPSARISLLWVWKHYTLQAKEPRAHPKPLQYSRKPRASTKALVGQTNYTGRFLSGHQVAGHDFQGWKPYLLWEGALPEIPKPSGRKLLNPKS